MVATNDIDVVIINWNTRDHLLRCVDSLLAEGITVGRIVVVDQGSADGSLEALSRYAGIRMLQNPANSGYAAAVNKGLREGHSPFVVVSNADVAVSRGSLAELMNIMNSDQSVSMVACRVDDLSGKNVTRFSRTSVSRGIALELVPSALRGTLRTIHQRLRRNGPAFQVTDIEGCFFLMRRSSVEEVGYLDEGFSFFFEDADLSLRMTKAGFRLLHVPSVSVVHGGGASFGKVPIRRAAEFYKNMVRFYHRHAQRRGIWLRRCIRIVASSKLMMLNLLHSALGKKMAGKLEFSIARTIAILESLKKNRAMTTGSSKGDPLVSVIIPTYDRPQQLDRCLESLKQQTYRNIEVIVVDQSVNSSAGSAPGVPNLTILRQKARNRSLAKNRGISRAKGEIVMFCDDDIVLSPDLIATHVEKHRDPSIGGVSCRTLDREVASQPNKTICKVLFYGKVIDRFSADTEQFVGTLVGGNMSIKRTILQEIGYFDSLFRGTSVFEEPDISSRISGLGYKLLFTNRSTAEHFPQWGGNADSRRRNPAQYYRDFHHNEIYYFLKNRHRFCLFFVIPFCFLRSIKQSMKFELSLKDALFMFSGVFDGFRTYYRSLR
ncbi:MAG TPA: glycosyltransferase family 2 protein [Bacteroidota bacterium]|nr:glycosyltransferase family 2 protein [Bacteroidota bacterium]